MILETRGNLSDHYDPTRKVIKLSTDIYHGSSIASAAVAAHECGHAIQDKTNYKPMRIRSKIVPTVNICTKLGYNLVEDKRHYFSLSSTRFTLHKLYHF
jgi:Zn-dependent membrane protease YugP